MAYYRDLTPYEYAGAEPQLDILNVGWLSCGQPLNTGFSDSSFVDALRRLVAHPTNLFRGQHFCEFCPPPLVKRSERGTPILDLKPGTYGNGEIRVRCDNGVTLVAPVLILHYVIEHHYLPPRQFVDAVLRSIE